MPENTVLNNPMLSFMMMQNPALSLQMQQQQALAQQLMQEGSEPSTTPQTAAGGMAIKQSPLEGLAKALEKGYGGYIQGRNNKTLADMLTPKSPKQQLSTATNAAIGSGEGPATADSVAQKLAAQMQPDSGGLPSLTGNSRKDMALYMMNPEAYTKGIVDTYGKTNLQKEVNDPATAPYHINDKLIKGGQDYINAPSTAPAPPTQAEPVIPGIATDPNIVKQNLPAPPAPVAGNIPPIPASPVNPSVIAQPPVIDKNSSAAIAGAKTEAEKSSENLADAQKTFNVTLSNLPRALTRFDELRKASKDASYGSEAWIDEQGDGIGPSIARSGPVNFVNPNTAKANQTIQQASKQGIIAELGPQLVGMRPNKFLESIATGASGLNAADPPETKVQAVNGLQDQYVGSLKSLAHQIKGLGGKAPSDDEIDAHIKEQVGKVSPSTMIRYNAQGKRM